MTGIPARRYRENSLEEHKQHLRALLERFQEHGILINLAKCVFGAQEVTFLGYNASSEGSRPLNGRVTDVQIYSPPQTVRRLLWFLEMINFYRRFLRDAAAIQTPLYAVLSGP